MRLSISPSGFLKLFMDKKFRTKDMAADYLDSIAAEARNLAEVWEQVVDELMTGSGEMGEDDPRIKDKLQEYKEPNAPYYYRLMNFYKEVSHVTAGRIDQEKREGFIDRLGWLLYNRKVTLKAYREALRHVKMSVFVDDQNSLHDFRDLTKLCNALHREAAAIEALAKSVRAKAG